MGHKLMCGIARLEKISANFNYDNAQKYVLLAKSFLAEARKISLDAPLFDVCGRLGLLLPLEISERFTAWVSTKPDFAHTTRKVCTWYLCDLHAMDLNLKPEASSIYEPLIQLLELGGDFYEHHGALCIRDVAMLRMLGDRRNW